MYDTYILYDCHVTYIYLCSSKLSSRRKFAKGHEVRINNCTGYTASYISHIIHIFLSSVELPAVPTSSSSFSDRTVICMRISIESVRRVVSSYNISHAFPLHITFPLDLHTGLWIVHKSHFHLSNTSEPIRKMQELNSMFYYLHWEAAFPLVQEKPRYHVVV